MSMRLRELLGDTPVTADVIRELTSLACKDDRTKQADKDACDINIIMRRNLESGVLPMSRQIPQFADISAMGTLQEALEVVREAGEFFMSLPARTREAFRNDPAIFAQAASDPAAAGLFRELGLTPADEAPPAAAGGASGTVPT